MELGTGFIVAAVISLLGCGCEGAPTDIPIWCASIPESDKVKFPQCSPGSSSSTGKLKTTITETATVVPPDMVSDQEMIREMCPETGGCEGPAAKRRLLSNSAMYEGDIAGMSKQALMTPADVAAQANAIRDEKKRWPDAVVPYYISPDIRSRGPQGKKFEKIIKDAMSVFHTETCIKFRPYQTGDTDYIALFAGIGCNSYVGKLGGRQNVQLQVPDCFSSGLIQHELMHALGFYHEQARYDRDTYVDINDKNIPPEDTIQFKAYLKPEITAYGMDYDFGSIMHYGRTDFGKNPSEWTIQPKPSFYDANVGKIGQRDRLSEIDIKKLRAMYRCTNAGPCSTNPGWYQYKGWCYYFSFIADELKKSYVDARNLCRKSDAMMANLRSEVIKEFVKPKLLDKLEDKSEAVWVDGCRMITATDSAAKDVPTCDMPAHLYVKNDLPRPPNLELSG